MAVSCASGQTGESGLRLPERRRRPREVWSWACYDFANSGYTGGGGHGDLQRLFRRRGGWQRHLGHFVWTAALSVSYAAIVVTAPLLGAWADAHAAKKRVLAVTTVGCIAGTAALYFAGLKFRHRHHGAGDLGNFLAPARTCDRRLPTRTCWRDRRWARSPVAGRSATSAALSPASPSPGVVFAQGQGDRQQYVPVTMLITAAIFALASLPTFPHPEGARPAPAPGQRRYAQTFARFRETVAAACRYRDLRASSSASCSYQAGVQTVISIAAIYAQPQAMGFRTQQTLLMLLVVNVTASIGAFAFGQFRTASATSAKRRLHAGVLVADHAGRLAGRMVRGCSGSPRTLPACAWVPASRPAARWSATWSPEARRAEFFGLWGVSVKLSSIFGPLTAWRRKWVSGGDHVAWPCSPPARSSSPGSIRRRVDPERGRDAAAAGWT